MDDVNDAPGEMPTWPERIVVGVDDSQQARGAVHRALQLASRAGSSVLLVHAVGLLEEGSFSPRPDLDEMRRAGLARTACRPGLVARPVFEDGIPGDVLVGVAGRVGADLIVVGRRGVGASARAIGSTSEAVLQRARMPVLVVSGHSCP